MARLMIGILIGGVVGYLLAHALRLDDIDGGHPL